MLGVGSKEEGLRAATKFLIMNAMEHDRKIKNKLSIKKIDRERIISVVDILNLKYLFACIYSLTVFAVSREKRISINIISSLRTDN